MMIDESYFAHGHTMCGVTKKPGRPRWIQLLQVLLFQSKETTMSSKPGGIDSFNRPVLISEYWSLIN
jgi:hypothetical protein